MMKLILASQSRGRRALLRLLNIPFEIIPSTLDEENIIGKTPLESIKLRAKLKGEEVTMKVQSSKIKDQKEPATKRLTLDAKRYLIISADSGAILDGQLIGKPKDYDEAVRILQTLSGRRHEFVTAVYLIQITDNSQQLTKKDVAKQDEIFADRISSAREKSYMDGRSGLRRARVAEQENYTREQKITSFIARSYVTFKKLSQDDIRTYLAMTNYTRYAGAYALFICPKCPRPGLTDLLSRQKYHELLEKTCTHTHLPNLIKKIEGSLSNVIGLPLEKLIPQLTGY